MNDLPRRQRVVVRVDFGTGPHRPTAVYTAPADVVMRFARELRAWNPDYTIKVQPAPDAEGSLPWLPYWQLFVWD